MEKIKKNKKLTLLLLSFLVISLIIIITKNYYLKADDKETILHYLETGLMPPSFGGDFTSSFKLLGTGNGEIYIWGQIIEFYENNGKLEKGSGMSVPVDLLVDRSGEGLKILDHKMPRDGEYYEESIEEIFPWRLHSKIYSFPGSSRRIDKLEEDIQKRLNN